MCAAAGSGAAASEAADRPTCGYAPSWVRVRVRVRVRVGVRGRGRGRGRVGVGVGVGDGLE